MRVKMRWLVPVGMIVAGLILIAIYVRGEPPPGLAVAPTATATIIATATANPTSTPEPIVPTRTPTSGAAVAPTASVTSSATTTHTGAAVDSTGTESTSRAVTTTATATATATAATTPFAASPTGEPTHQSTPPADAAILPPPFYQRFGVAGQHQQILNAIDAGLPLSTYLNWRVSSDPVRLPGGFWQMVRLSQGGVRTSWSDIETAVAANPGAIWIIGNEPDVTWQDSVTPQRYAELYHDVYTFIKARDPGAKIATAGVSQPTPLRLAYLDIVLDTYQATYGQPMPVDIWTVHNFVLREEAESWGVGIPPGMSGPGRLYEIDDHDNIDIFRQHLVDFRNWMTARGYGNRPLAVTEYGILMPADYGFPPEEVGRFLTQTFDVFVSLANGNGYAPDSNRLVQWWFWYSLYDGGQYPSGNLFDVNRGQLTAVGQAFADYVNRYR